MTVHDSSGGQQVVPWFSANNSMEQICVELFTKEHGAHPFLPSSSSVTLGLWAASVPGDEMGINRPKLLLDYFSVHLMNDMSLYYEHLN